MARCESWAGIVAIFDRLDRRSDAHRGLHPRFKLVLCFEAFYADPNADPSTVVRYDDGYVLMVADAVPAPAPAPAPGPPSDSLAAAGLAEAPRSRAAVGRDAAAPGGNRQPGSAAGIAPRIGLGPGMHGEGTGKMCGQPRLRDGTWLDDIVGAHHGADRRGGVGRATGVPCQR